MFTRGMKPRQKRAATNVLNRMQANPDWARQVRERAKLTLEEMGRLCGASHSSVSRWERMVTMPDDADEAYGAWVSILDRWAGNEPVRGSRLVDALACSVVGCDWIPEGPEPFSHNSPEARELARQAVRHQRECVLRGNGVTDDTAAFQAWVDNDGCRGVINGSRLAKNPSNSGAVWPGKSGSEASFSFDVVPRLDERLIRSSRTIRWNQDDPLRSPRMSCGCGQEWVFVETSESVPEVDVNELFAQHECGENTTSKTILVHVPPKSRVSIVPISKPEGSPKRYMVRCNDCLKVLDQELTKQEAEAVRTGHDCGETVDLGTPSEVVR